MFFNWLNNLRSEEAQVTAHQVRPLSPSGEGEGGVAGKLSSFDLLTA
jgi:hypothetical protein